MNKHNFGSKILRNLHYRGYTARDGFKKVHSLIKLVTDFFRLLLHFLNKRTVGIILRSGCKFSRSEKTANSARKLHYGAN